MRIIPTAAGQELIHFDPNHPVYVPDVSLESPDQQFATLVALIEHNDALSPAPFTGTPPWGEPTPVEEYPPEQLLAENYMPAADLEPQAEHSLEALINDAWGVSIPEWTWYNDDQYFGLGVPPGSPNVQPYETGHSQIQRQNPAAEKGRFAWSGKPEARQSRHENNFPGYNAGQSRGHGVVPIKLYQPYFLRTQQSRDLLLSELNRRGIHNVVIADIPAVPYTEQVQVVDPTVMAPEPVMGPEGWTGH